VKSILHFVTIIRVKIHPTGVDVWILVHGL
jgi:hypothetical protein